MTLRTQILLFLSLFGLLPLLAAIVLNLPPVLERFQAHYSELHLQNLRADFSDLDQYLASRSETVSLLTKWPEPGARAASEVTPPADGIDAARVRYTQWVNRILADRIDITDVIFLDSGGIEQFWLQRDVQSKELQPGPIPPVATDPELLAASAALPPGAVASSALSINRTVAAEDPQHYLTLRMVSPLRSGSPGTQFPQHGTPSGYVVISLDVSNLANTYPGTYWVQNDGRYLTSPAALRDQAPRAFDEFPGLETLFATSRLGLWNDRDDNPVLWVPLFATRDNGPIWVGRKVDPSPATDFLASLRNRILTIVAGLLLVTVVAARWVAIRTERLGVQLREGISRALNGDKPVTFSWRGSQELRSLGNDLTKLMARHARRSQDLHNYSLELEATNAYKSEFLANVSHELRTPLNSILLLSRLLGDNDECNLTHDQVRQLEVINTAGQDLLALIDQILDLSRLEAQAATIDLQTVDLPSLLDGLIDMISPLCAEKALTLELITDPETATEIVSDAGKLRQIIKNFLSNAVKFTEQGGIRVELTSNHDTDAAQRPIALRVIDSGIGIAAEKHALVFAAFRQADGSTHRRYGGTGLGLSISRELANLLGGRISLTSRPGEGATFSLLLPLAFDADSVPPEQVNRELLERQSHLPRPSADPQGTPPFSGRRVLLVDDDLRNLLALTPLLERWGIDVTAAGDGEEALETLASDAAFDAILMDVMMPVMDGVETTRRLRQDPRFDTIPIIALTAKIDDDERQRCASAGILAFVTKPIDADTLQMHLETLLPPQ